MRRWAGLAVIAAGVALAVVIGQRMSSDAMAVAVGVVFGVAASIPTSLLVVAATRGRRQPPSPPSEPLPPPPPPQIYIVSPGAGSMPGVWPGLEGRSPWPAPPTGYALGQPARRYKVVGENEHWLDEDSSWE